MTHLQAEFISMIMPLIKQKRIEEMKQYIQHGSVNCYRHSVAVAYYSFLFIRKLHIRCDEAALIRGALLHDYYLYDWHEKAEWHRWHGFHHPNTALHNANGDFLLNEREQEIIRKHMWPLTLIPPTCREAWIVNVVDSISSIMEFLMNRRPFHALEDKWFAHSTIIEDRLHTLIANKANDGNVTPL